MQDHGNTMQHEFTEVEFTLMQACLTGQGWRRRAYDEVLAMLLVLAAAAATLVALEADTRVAALVLGGIVIASAVQNVVHQPRMVLYETVMWKLLTRIRDMKRRHRRLAAAVRRADDAQKAREAQRPPTTELSPALTSRPPSRTIRDAPRHPIPTGHGVDSCWSDDVRIARHACAETSPSRSFVKHRR